AVVHEQPAVMGEGVAIRPAGGGAGRRAHMGEEQTGADLVRQALQVGIVPGRQDVAVDAGHLAIAVPADPEAVAVGRHMRLAGVQALMDERVLGLEDERIQIDWLSAIGEPAAHGSSPRSGRRRPEGLTASPGPANGRLISYRKEGVSVYALPGTAQ